MPITNPAFDYNAQGQSYSAQRQTEPRIFFINKTLGDAKTVLNVGAGAGSYEPTDRYVVAVEPSFVMREQRRAHNRIPAIIGKADNLPFDDDSFDASMAMLTVHHWQGMRRGLQELHRVTKNQVIIMTFDPAALDAFWNAEYFPDVIEVEKQRYPTISFIKEVLGVTCEVEKIPVPFDCVDGFQEAFYGRPEAFLQKEVRQSQSAWGFISREREEELVQRFAQELASGEWDKKWGHYRTQPEFTCALRLIIANP